MRGSGVLPSVDVVSHIGYEVGGQSSRLVRDEAISQLLVAHHRRLVGFAVLLVDDRETAEDLVQEAFATLFGRWGICSVTRRRLWATCGAAW